MDVAERNSGFKRIEADDYSTPPWPVEALCAAEHFRDPVWEIAPGAGFMVRALQDAGHRVITAWPDFRVHSSCAPNADVDAPPNVRYRG
jgi:hypothetical protein